MSLERCIEIIRRASGGVLGEQEVLDALARLEARARRRRRQGGDPAFARAELERAAAEMADEARRKAVHARMVAMSNVLRRERLLQDLERMKAQGLNYADGLKALMAGVASRAGGSRKSAWSMQKAYLARYWGAIMGRIARERPHLEKLIARAGRLRGPDPEFVAFDRRVLREMERIGREDAIPPTGDEDAAWLARLFHEVTEAARRDLVELGADIGKLEGWTPHVHDAWRVARVSEDEWIAFVKPLLDLERSFPDLEDEADIDRVLRDIYRNIVTGRDLRLRGDPDRPRFGARMTRVFERERVLHFKPGAWATYSERFGLGTLTASVFAHLRRAAQRAGIMEIFGPNPEAMLDHITEALTLRVRLTGRTDRAAAKEINKLRQAREWPSWRVLTGQTSAPGNETLAAIGEGARAIEVLSKLMAAVLSAVPTDPIIMGANMRFAGKSLVRAYADSFGEFFRGRGKGEARELAFYLGEGFQGLIDQTLTPYADFESTPGLMHRLTSWAFRISGLTGWTDIGRAGAARQFTAWIGRHTRLPWAELPEDLRHLLRLHDFDARTWELVRRATVEVRGVPHVSPAAIAAIPDIDILALARDRVEALEAGLSERIRARAAASRRERQMLARRLERLAAWAEQLVDRWHRKTARVELATRAKVQRLDARIATLLMRLDRIDAWFRDRELGVRLRLEDAATPREKAALLREGRRQGRDEGRLLERLDALTREANALERGLERELADLERSMKRQIRQKLDEVRRLAADLEKRWKERDLEDARDRERFQLALEAIAAETRRELDVRLRAMIADEVSYAIIEPDVRTRAVATGGLRRGTLPGELVRAMMQFKSFAVGFTQRVLGRRLYAARTPWAGMAGLAELMALLTVGGLFATWAKDVSRGRTPKALFDDRDNVRFETLLAAMLQGGGLGIYGDFLFGSYNRFNRGAFETLSGPLIGDIAELLGLYEDIRAGEPRASRFVNFAIGTTPFLNLWYTRAAVDVLFLNALREGVSPGWLARERRRMRERYGQTWIFGPTLEEVTR